jgi:hypothetical protein
MARNILILGASYGSLLGTKLLMAGHNVTLVCRKKTAELTNRDGTEVRIKLRDEAVHRAIFSRDLPGKLDAVTPQDVDISRYDLVGLAMQEPQYTNHTIRVLMVKIAEAKLPCLSIMNMPPLPYLKRIGALRDMDLEEAYTNASVWERFEPGLVSLCSPDPQAFRPPEEGANVLHVGLPTNFKAATFADEAHNRMLRELEADVEAFLLGVGRMLAALDQRGRHGDPRPGRRLPAALAPRGGRDPGPHRVQPVLQGPVRLGRLPQHHLRVRERRA